MNKGVDRIKFVLLSLLLAGIYQSAFGWLVIKDWGREDYSYGYIIPLVSCYLIFEKRNQISRLTPSPTWKGLAMLVFGLCLFWLGEFSGDFFSVYISFWFVLVGLCWSWIGWQKLKVITFPLVILLSMFPPPVFISNSITLKLKLISSKLGVWMLQAYGMSAYREGNVIDLGFTQLQVVDACSGLRYLFPLLIMGLLLAYFYKAALWKRILLVISSVPLTIITNSLRIAMTGVLYEVWGPAVAEDFFHGFSGWLIFIFGLAVLLFEIWALKGFRGFGLLTADLRRQAQTKEGVVSPNDAGRENASASEQGALHKTGQPADGATGRPAFLTPNTSNFKPPAPNGWRAFLQPPQFIVAVMLLAGTLALAQGVEFREKIPPAKSFASFPTQVGDWTGKRDVMEEKFIKELDLNDYVIVDYQNGGHAVNFYTAYYESQRKGESIHSPETCLPGSGWEFKNAGKAVIPFYARAGSTGQRANGPTSSMTVNKAFMEKGTQKQLSYFWFPQRDRVLTNAWELKIYNFWDALTRQRTDGALVRLITPVYANEDVAKAEARLTAFTQEIVPVLNEFLPK